MSKSRSSSALAHVLMLVGGTGTSQILMTLSAPLLTRIYTPHDFGVYAVSLAIFNILATVVCLRYEMAIVLPRADGVAANVAVLAMAVAIGVTLVATLLCVASWLVPPLLHYPALQGWAVLLIPIGVLFYGAQQVLRMWFVRRREFSTITKMVLTQTLATVGVQLGFGLLVSSHPAWLMLGTVAGTVGMVLVALPRFAKTFPARLFGAVRVSRLAAFARRYRRFPIFSSPYNFMAQAANRLLLLILAIFVPTATIGEFALAQRVVYLPVSIITASMGQVFYSRAVQQLGDDRLQCFVLRIMTAGVLVLGPVIGFNFHFAEQIFRFAFGERWALAGNFAAYLAIASGVITLTAWLDRIYDIRDRQRLALGLEAFNDVLCLGSLFLMMKLTRDPILGVAAFSLATVAFYLLWTFVTFRIAPFPGRFFAGFAGSLAVVFVAMALFNVAARELLASESWRLLLLAAVSAPLVAVGLIIGRNGLRQRETRLGPLRV